MSWWNVVHKGTKAAVRTADGHYSRQKPGTSQFTRPGGHYADQGAVDG